MMVAAPPLVVVVLVFFFAGSTSGVAADEPTKPALNDPKLVTRGVLGRRAVFST
jgi:hypothetical protein